MQIKKKHKFSLLNPLSNYCLLLLAYCSLSFTGCDIFDTRDAETPNQPRANFQTPVTPEIVIENLINSLQDQNVENYVSCFSDSDFTEKIFRFSPTSSAASQFPFLTIDWNKKDEEQYFNNMKTKVPENSSISLNLSNVSSSPQGDSLIYSASYLLTVPHNDESIPMNYQGDLRFSMIRDDRATWSIYYWQDIKSGELSSWSELKGRFY